ncbi:MAG: hypothetical protein QF830_00570, partial [Rhodospirillales bacterium]|nr:hypothetical protein [Rhodospirillales bacterium]
ASAAMLQMVPHMRLIDQPPSQLKKYHRYLAAEAAHPTPRRGPSFRATLIVLANLTRYSPYNLQMHGNHI